MAERLVLDVCGNSRKVAISKHFEGWRRVILDIDPRGKPDVVADARELTKLPAAAYDAVYCSHGLEHFYEHEVPAVLAGMKHVLKPGGFVELRLPNLGAVMAHVVANNLDLEDVLYRSSAGPVRPIDILYGYQSKIATTKQDFFAHRSGFTKASLERAIKAARFANFAHLTKPRPWELAVVAFTGEPTEEQMRLLELKRPARRKSAT